MEIVSSILRHTLFVAICTAVQACVVFGAVFLLAFAMYCVSSEIRRIGARRLGFLYFYIAAPGVACHEAGHALGCLLSGIKIMKFVPFAPSSDGTLGYVINAAPRNMFQRAACFIIATGPVWFGCAMIALLSYLFLGQAFIDELAASTQADGANAVDYFAAIFDSALKMAARFLLPWNWESAFSVLFVYLIFCIASEITLSQEDIKNAIPGFRALLGIIFTVNLFTGGGPFAGEGGFSVLPFHGVILAVMAFVLIVDCAFLFLLKLIEGRLK